MTSEDRIGLVVFALACAAVIAPAVALEGPPAKVWTGTDPTAGAACIGARVVATQANPTKLFCCISSAWADCTPSSFLSASVLRLPVASSEPIACTAAKEGALFYAEGAGLVYGGLAVCACNGDKSGCSWQINGSDWP